MIWERDGDDTYMFVVLFEDPAQEFVLCVVDCLDDVLIIAGEVEEAPGFAGRACVKVSGDSKRYCGND